MRIVVTHSSGYDFKNELYTPLKKSILNKNSKIFFPLEDDKPEVVTRDIIKNSDVVVAEVSYPSTGQGIELGWADIYGIPIICMYKRGFKISNSLNKMTDKFFTYDTQESMINQLVKMLENIKSVSATD